MIPTRDKIFLWRSCIFFIFVHFHIYIYWERERKIDYKAIQVEGEIYWQEKVGFLISESGKTLTTS